jgi:hypothetical protein
MKKLLFMMILAFGAVQYSAAFEPALIDNQANMQDKYSPASPLPSASGDNPQHGYPSDSGYSNIPEASGSPPSDSGYTDYGDPNNPRPMLDK